MPLTEYTLEGPIDRVAVAIERLRSFEPPEGYWLAFSGVDNVHGLRYN